MAKSKAYWTIWLRKVVKLPQIQSRMALQCRQTFGIQPLPSLQHPQHSLAMVNLASSQWRLLKLQNGLTACLWIMQLLGNCFSATERCSITFHSW